MKNKYRILKIILLLGILGYTLYFSLKRFNETKIQKIVIEMEQKEPVYFLTQNDIRELIAQVDPDFTCGGLNVRDLERNIRKKSAVDSANVHLGLNGCLSINIFQKIPMLRVQNGENNYYLDEKAERFAISKNYSHPTLLAEGNIKTKEYADLVNLVKFINSDAYLKKYFIGIRKINQGLFVLKTHNGNFNVELGDMKNIEVKLLGFKSFLEKHLAFEDPQKYSKISLKYNNQIVATKTDKPILKEDQPNQDTKIN